MKINKLRIQNFKIFEKIDLNFSDYDLIVFDGPNGFGKTSIYDAIELLFIGSIRRFIDLREKVVDGRESFAEHPFLYEFANGDISITISFTKDDVEYILERYVAQTDITNTVNFDIYKLYQKETFDSDKRSLIDNEKEFLEPLVGENYKENFQFLNYIEQEESLFLLKSQDKVRKSNISHLFNVAEFEDRINKISLVKRKISELCNTVEEKKIADLEILVNNTEEFLKSEFKNTEYIKLFNDWELIWDNVEFDYTTITYQDLFSSEGIIPKIKKLIENKHTFSIYRNNELIEMLISDEERLNQFFTYYYFISSKDSLRLQKVDYDKESKIIQLLSNISIDDIKRNRLEITFEELGFSDIKIIESYESELEVLKNSLNELDKLESIYSGIKETREKLIHRIIELKEESEISGICFLCGYDWGNIDELLTNINFESEQLENLASDKSLLFDERFNKFKDETVIPIINYLNNKALEKNLDINFIDKLLLQNETFLNSSKINLERIGFNYTELLNKVASTESLIDIEKIVSDLQLLKRELDINEIQPYFNEVFAQYFENNFSILNSLTTEQVEQKENYLKYKYSLLQNEYLVGKKAELKNKKDKFINAASLASNLNRIESTYKNSLKAYQRKVIKDIEVIFHIYSGRILQDLQGGLGLFIFSDKDGIRFQTNPSKTFDAVFSMSSGQLSALIISFTLALHKKYSKNSILLIDDPVQTMDEINIVGFTELLRNEFSSNQIIISTHEDIPSVFMRYKFKSYGLNQIGINLKTYHN
ncbi:AAA family ATPase [uncultured Chryseobacterium sp.]|uniref:AAA family ATPase n=1 Tax=uncultured Chryseobacterium sp. TaxID=259322 RepID=UPI00258672E4|nr:AAA family ATPase [uncultured Chryseobacterium sp.]